MESVKEGVPIIKEELPDGQTTLCGAGDISDTNVFSEFVLKKQIPIIKEELPDKRTMFGGGDVLNSKVFSKINKTRSKMESVKEQVPIIKKELPEGQTSLCGAGDILDTNVFSEFVSKKQNPIIKEELPDKRTMFGGGDIRILKVFSKNTHLEANAARSEKESSYSSAQALCEICGKNFTSAEAARVHVTVHTGHMSVLPNPAEKSERAIKQSEAVDKQSEAKKQSGEADEQSGRAEKQSRGADKKRDKPDKQSGETEIASQSHVPGGTMDTESSDDDEESTLTHLPESTPSSSESAVNPAKKLDRGRPLTRSPISYRQRNKRKCPVCYRDYGTHLARHFERNHPDINPNMYRHHRGDGNPGRERMVGCKICRKNLNLSSFPKHFRRVHKDIEATVRSPKYKASMGPAIYSHIDQLNRFLDRHIACRKLSSTAAERERKYVIDFLSQNDRKSPEEMVASLLINISKNIGHMSVLPNPTEKNGRAIKQSEAVDKQSEAKKQSGEADEQSGRAEKQSRGADKKRDKPDKQSGETEIASQSHVPGGTMDTESSDDDEESTLTHLPKSTPSSSESAVNPAKKLDRGRPLTRSPISYRQRNKRKCPVCYRDYGTHLARHFERNHPDINPNMYRHRRGDGNPGRERMVGCKICRKNLNLSSFPRHFRRVHKDIEATVRSPKYKSSMGPAIYSHIDQLNRFLDRHIACRKLSSTAAERERKYVIDFLSQNDRKSPEEMVASLTEGISASCAHAKISAIILFLKFMKSVSDEPGADVIITKQRNSYMHHLLKTFSPVVSREKIRDATAQLMRDKDKMNKNYSAVKRMANGRQHCNFLQKDINDENYNDCLAALVVDTILVTGTRPMFFYSLSSEEIQKPLCKPTDSDNNYVLQFKKNKQRSGIGYFVLKTQQKERLDELAAFSNPAFKNKKVAILTLNGKPLNSSTMAKYVKRYLKRYEVHLTLQLLRKLANTMAALLPEEMKECVSMAGDHPKSVAMRYYQTLERRHRARKGGEILDMIWKNNLKREGNDLEMDMRRAGKIFECILEETKLPEPEKREYDEKNFEEKSIEAQQEVSSDEEGSIEKMKCKEKVDLNARTQEMEKEKGKKRTKDEDEDSPTLAQWLDLAPKSKKQKSGRKSSKAMAGDKKGGRDFVMKNFLSEIPSTSAQPPTPLATESTRNRKRKNGCPEKSGAEKTMAFKLPRISGGPNSFTQNLLVAFIYDDRLKGYLFENETLPSAKVSTLAMELDVECEGLVSKLKWVKKSLQTLF